MKEMQIQQIFFIEEERETILHFSQETVRVLQIYFALTKYQYKMAQYNTLNVKLFNSQINKLKSSIKNGTEETLNVPSNLISNSNDETNFPKYWFAFNEKYTETIS